MPDKAAVRAQLEASIAYVRNRIYTLEDYTARTLLGLYQKAFNELMARLQATFDANASGTWQASDVAFTRRTQALVDQIAQEMTRLNEQVLNVIVDDQVNAYRASYYGNGWIVDKFTPQDYTAQVPLLPTEAIRAQLLFPYENNTQFFRLEANRQDFIDKLRRAMVQSQIQGETIYQAQKRLADELGIDIGRRKLSDRLANSGNFYRTEMIARTEILRASNLGAMATYEANPDVVKEVEFMATLDMRTCFICGPHDGQRYPVDDVVDLPPLHPCCRCSVAPVTISFADMGINAPEMGHGSRASVFGPVSGSLSYSQWAAQNGIMQSEDGGLRDLPPSKPTKSPGAAPVRVAVLRARGLAVK